MTALDQAFTKVYRQQAAGDKAAPSVDASAAPQAKPAAQPMPMPQPAIRPAAQPMPPLTVAARPAPALAQAAAKSAESAPQGKTGAGNVSLPQGGSVSLPSCGKPTLPTVRLIPPGRTRPAPTLDELDIDRSICKVAAEAPPAPPPPPATKLPEPAAQAAQPVPRLSTLLPKVAPAPRAIEPAPQAHPQPAAAPQQTILRILRPATRIPSFAWPQICDRLLNTAGDQFHQLADALLIAKSQGRKVIAISGSHRGEGATSVLLAAARRLTERGIRLALVDADWDNPALGAQLTLKVDRGWQGVLAGDVPLAGAVIEAADTRMAVLPLRTDRAPSSQPWEQALGVAETIETIAQNYDLVLVDAGPILPDAPKGKPAWRGLGGCLDAAVLVQKIDEGAEQRVAESEQALAAAGVAALGIVQNFVRD